MKKGVGYGVGSGSISQRNGSQNVTDPLHWLQQSAGAILLYSLSGPTMVLPLPRNDFSMFPPISHRQEPAIKIRWRANF